ncbi:MAG: folylpolyglutamate synthase [Sphingomonas bacterium]|uniref:bifunctional folylpolyglutamate synthase/dihydrofolate synthase n=1 Tax=Sphingomonas bacterium TaxID=1895847 RepID=UPI0026108CFF|nr:Mur ligase family protein [Sphingomonas bacterium]MDB5695758.1 folylpolyglutamate synthase [Sphingomonas bacterium]
MPDTATSTDPAVQAQLDRLFAHGPGADTLGLDRITRLLARLGDPHRHLPPVFHVAGTNGKGSTCAFLRAALEAAGRSVHVYTSPHLVRFNERIRLAGALIEDATLAPLLAEVLDVAEDLNASFFEVTTAAAFLAFAREPADACVVEVGLGGRLDATNVLPAPAVCGIAGLGVDHQAFLGDTLAAIAAEKAGIAKCGVPLVTMDYDAPINDVIADLAKRAGAPFYPAGRRWNLGANPRLRRVFISDEDGSIALPFPEMAGDHQMANLALAAAMVRRQRAIEIPPAALKAAATTACWPARMQRLRPGPLAGMLPDEAELWIDGAHNPSAALPVADTLAELAQGRATTLVLGMLANKDAAGVLAALAPAVSQVIAVPTPGHTHHAPEYLASLARNARLPAAIAPDLSAAVAQADTPVVLIAGSLYLAGEALRLNDELPD